MSVIIDIMDQSHCNIPFLGSQKRINNPLHQIVVGVKEHGYGITLYRVVETVAKGANLIMYCFLRQLEKWKIRHNGEYPDEIYLQADGGSENANQWVLGMLELLVIKRVTRRILFTRLPTGHTHEDIDAVFGIIWNWMKTRVCETFEDYEKMVLSAFSKESCPSMENVYIIPDLTKLFDDCIDKKLKHLHREPYTQHQWKFEFIETDPLFFPTGCKTMYRAYSSSRVIEFHILPKDQCRSCIGQYCGLEPFTLYSRWYPTKDSIPGRNVEGFRILTKIPHWNEKELFPPCDVEPSSYLNIHKMIAEVSSIFCRQQADEIRIVESWKNWNKRFGPPQPPVSIRRGNQQSQQRNREEQKQDDQRIKDISPISGVKYLMKLQEQNDDEEDFYIVPLSDILLNSNFVCEPKEKWKHYKLFSNNIAPSNDEDKTVWPETLCAATNSVMSEFNPNPLPPRIFIVNDDALMASINDFDEKTILYYRNHLTNITNENLKQLLFRSIFIDGIDPVSGQTTKPALIKKIFDRHLTFVRRFLSPLNDVNAFYVSRKLLRLATAIKQGMENEEVSKIGEISIKQIVIMQLGNVLYQRVDCETVEGIMALFRQRDRYIAKLLERNENYSHDTEDKYIDDNVLAAGKKRRKPNNITNNDNNCQRKNRTQTFLESIFIPPTTISELIREFADESNFVNDIISIIKNNQDTRKLLSEFDDFPLYNQCYRAYFPVTYDDQAGGNGTSRNKNWILIVYEYANNLVYFVDPKRGTHLKPASNENVQLQALENALTTFLTRKYRFAEPIKISKISPWPWQYYRLQEDDLNSVLYLYLIMYYIVNECPICFTLSQDTTEIRHHLIYALLNTHLPI
jgi:hypothetical protein